MSLDTKALVDSPAPLRLPVPGFANEPRATQRMMEKADFDALYEMVCFQAADSISAGAAIMTGTLVVRMAPSHILERSQYIAMDDIASQGEFGRLAMKDYIGSMIQRSGVDLCVFLSQQAPDPASAESELEHLLIEIISKEVQSVNLLPIRLSHDHAALDVVPLTFVQPGQAKPASALPYSRRLHA
jgi:hypothetical protein